MTSFVFEEEDDWIHDVSNSSASFDTIEDVLDFPAFQYTSAVISASSASSSNSSNSSSSGGNEETDDHINNTSIAKKRKRIDTRKTRPERYVNPFGQPRILKRDIRRDYGNMIINVLNSNDKCLMLAFFAKYCLPPGVRKDVDRSLNAQQTPAFNKTASTSSFHPISYIQSISNDAEWGPMEPEYMVDHMEVTTEAMPDFLVGLDQYSIQQHKDQHQSWIMCTMNFSGTVTNVQKMLETNHSKLSNVATLDRGNFLDKQGAVILYLNEDNFIYKMMMKSTGWRLRHRSHL